jgi:hypothetical protein
MKVLNNKRGIKIKKDLFGNTPNLVLRGSTFDVSHLHKFITQGGAPSPLSFYPRNSHTPVVELNSGKSQADSNTLFSRSKASRGLSHDRNSSK